MRKLNPLGIRKLDVQEARRVARKEHEETAKRLVELWFVKGGPGIEIPTGERLRQFAEVMLDTGWEGGVKVGASATRARVAESLASGALVRDEAVKL